MNPTEAPIMTDWSLTIPDPIPPGLHDAEIVSVELRVAEADGREWLAWTFRLDDGRELGGGSSFTVSPRSKTYGWVSAIVGRARMGGGETIRAADLIGARVTLSIEPDDDGQARVAAVLPARAEPPAKGKADA
jgi:hypothetical protein